MLFANRIRLYPLRNEIFSTRKNADELPIAIREINIEIERLKCEAKLCQGFSSGAVWDG